MKHLLCLLCWIFAIYGAIGIAQIMMYSNINNNITDKSDHVDYNNYSPSVCTVLNYKFTFLYDDNSGTYKVHGLWPELCSECTSCGYPSCCNLNMLKVVPPNDPDNFVQNYWFNSTSRECCDKYGELSLFYHEFIKHASCTTFSLSTTEFVNTVQNLYNKYYSYVEHSGCDTEQIWLSLDSQLNYVNTQCV